MDNTAADVDDEFECYISFGNVKKQVLKYLDTHKHVSTSDIVFDLGIDIDLVVEALNVLEEEGLVEGKPVKVEINNSN
ncbi:MAG: ArsR family transcriptional regulator [Candidatus Bathyarchaeota archaeon]|nr:ArsR family transcriptional regulator [Candidatus Termiticorpusculum sp.]